MRWRRPMVQEIARAVSRYSRVTLQELHGRSSAPIIVRARHLAMFMSRVDSGRSYPQIASFFGRDHTTIIHAHGVIAGLGSSSDPEVQNQIRADLHAVRTLIAASIDDSPEAAELRKPITPAPECKLCELLREDLALARQELANLRAELTIARGTPPATK